MKLPIGKTKMKLSSESAINEVVDGRDYNEAIQGKVRLSRVKFYAPVEPLWSCRAGLFI